MTDLIHADEPGGECEAEAVIVLGAEAFEAALVGDVLAAARIAGILAAKKTAEMIPLAAAGSLAKIDVTFDNLPERHAIRVTVTCGGAETAAMTAVAIAALTIYDMTKGLGEAVIESVRVIAKAGSKVATPRVSAIAPSQRPGSRQLRCRDGAPPSAHFRSRPSAGDDISFSPETIGKRPAAVPGPDGGRAALRTFMTSRHLRATEWAKQAGIPASQLYAFLTGRLRVLPDCVIQKLARAAKVNPEDLLR